MNFLAGIATLVLLAAPPAAEPHPRPTAKAVVETIEQLRAIGVREDGVIPPKVPSLMKQLKDGLRDLVADLLTGEKRDAAFVDIWDRVADELRKAGWKELPNENWRAYGELIDIETNKFSDWLTVSGGRVGVLMVAAILWFPCSFQEPGVDPPLWVFEKRNNKWELVVSVEFEEQFAEHRVYSVSPALSDGSWFLVVADTPASCRFRRNDVRFRVYRPGDEPSQPVMVLEDRLRGEPGRPPRYRINVHEDWTSIAWIDKRRFDDEPSVLISRWQIEGDRAVRIQPLARDPEDFVDLWAQMPWEEAAKWTTAEKTQDLQRWHATVGGLLPGGTHIDFVQPCPANSPWPTWQIGLELDGNDAKRTGAENVYVSVKREHGSFYVTSIGASRPAGCPGAQQLPLKNLDITFVP